MKFLLWRMLWKEVTASAKVLALDGSQCVEETNRSAEMAHSGSGRVSRDKVRERERSFGVNDWGEDIDLRRIVICLTCYGLSMAAILRDNKEAKDQSITSAWNVPWRRMLRLNSHMEGVKTQLMVSSPTFSTPIVYMGFLTC